MWPKCHIWQARRFRCSARRYRLHAVLVACSLAGIGTSSAAADVWDDCRSGQPDKALEACATVIEKGERVPDDLAAAHLARGIAFHAKGMLDQALAEFDQALDLNPKLANALVNRGMVRRLKRDLDLSLADLDRAIEIDPKNPRARAERGLTHTDRREWQAALEDIDQSITLRPDYAFGYLSRAFTSAQMGELDRALGDL